MMEQVIANVLRTLRIHTNGFIGLLHRPAESETTMNRALVGVCVGADCPSPEQQKVVDLPQPPDADDTVRVTVALLAAFTSFSASQTNRRESGRNQLITGDICPLFSHNPTTNRPDIRDKSSMVADALVPVQP